MGEEPKSTEPPTSNEPPRRPQVLGDTSLRFEPPPQESVPETPPAAASPRPATTPFGAPPPPVVEAPRQTAPQPRVARPAAKPVTPFAPPPVAGPAQQPRPAAAPPPAAGPQPRPAASPTPVTGPTKQPRPAAAPPTVKQASPPEPPPPVTKATPAKTAPAKATAKKAAPAKVAAKTVPAARTSEQLVPATEPAQVTPPEAAAPAKKAAKKAVAKKAPAKKAAPKVEVESKAAIEPTPETTPVKKAPVKKAAVKKAAVKATSTQEVLFPAPKSPEAPAAPEPAPEAPAAPEATDAPKAAEAPRETEAAEQAEAAEAAPVVDEVTLVERRVEVVEADPTDLGVPETTRETEPGGRGINPAYLPELLALAAVARLGEAARERAAWYAANYPGVDGDAIGRAVTREFVRRARRLGIAAGAAGSLGLVVEAAGVNWLHAKLVLHLAAAHGHDPLDRARAAELLVLQRVYAEVATAEAAIMAAEQAQRSRRAGPGVGVARLAGPLGRTLGGGLLQAAGVRIARHAVPGIGPVIGAVAAVRSTEAIAMRATRYYRRKPVPTPDGR
ncbi:hypothetical protein GCM10009827_017010 [Dactylosporangium maewongense]|uniref:EcsC family protein n=1 Tax=Dactylosporangium maewongense TaxID=634393 RepID=A0ABN1ZTJ5_9ACTN